MRTWQKNVVRYPQPETETGGNTVYKVIVDCRTLDGNGLVRITVAEYALLRTANRKAWDIANHCVSGPGSGDCVSVGVLSPDGHYAIPSIAA